MNNDLNDSNDLHVFLQADDEKYKLYKEKLALRIAEPLNQKLAYVLSADQIQNSSYTESAKALATGALSSVAHPIQTITSISSWIPSVRSAEKPKAPIDPKMNPTGQAAEIQVLQDRETKNQLEKFKSEEDYLENLLPAFEKIVEKYELEIEICRQESSSHNKMSARLQVLHQVESDYNHKQNQRRFSSL